MIYQANELLAKLRHLTLVGQDEEGKLKWVGTQEHWKNCVLEEEAILRDWELNKI